MEGMGDWGGGADVVVGVGEEKAKGGGEEEGTPVEVNDVWKEEIL